MPPPLLAEALIVATYIPNGRLSTTIHFDTPYSRLFEAPPNLSTLCVFKCLFSPNTASTAAHKLAPRSILCVFLGYPLYHKGYCCLHHITMHIIISHRVVIYETTFPFSFTPTQPWSNQFDFLADPTNLTNPTQWCIFCPLQVLSATTSAVPGLLTAPRLTVVGHALCTVS